MHSDGGLDLHWVRQGASTAMAMVAETAGYVSVGFSGSAMMVGADAVIGWLDGSSAHVGDYYLAGKAVSQVVPSSVPFTTNASASYVDGKTTVHFVLPDETVPEHFDPTEPTTVIYAYSPTPALAYHPDRGQFSLVFAGATLGMAVPAAKPSYPALAAHGVLMVAAWGVLLPLGTLIGRLRGLLRPGRWYAAHRAVQTIGLVVACVGLVLVFAFPEEFGPIDTAHGATGFAVMGLGLAQPLNALARPHAPAANEAKAATRAVWEGIHKGAGYAALLLACVATLLGIGRYARVAALEHATEVALYASYGVLLGLLLLGFVLGSARQAAQQKLSGVDVASSSTSTSPGKDAAPVKQAAPVAVQEVEKV